MESESVQSWSLSKQDTMALKGIAIIAMLFHHVYCSIPDWIEPCYGVFGWLGKLGKVCVAMFLFCSGYGLSNQYDKVDGIKAICKFMFKRFVSFYFNYWVVFGVFVPITVLFFHRPLVAAYGENVNLMKRLVYDFFGVQGFSSYNITWWFNKLLLILYLLFPFLYLGVRKSGVVTLLLSFLVCGFWMTIVGYDYYGTLYVFQFPFILGILWNKWSKVGGIMGNTLDRKFGEKPRVFVLVVLSFLVIMVLFRMYPILPHWTSIRMDAFVTLGIVMLVVSLRHLGLSMRALAFMGKHSANIYLIHTFYNDYWHLSWLHKGAVMRSGLDFIVLLLMCLLTSIVLEYVKERLGVYRLLNLIKHKLS